MGKINNFDVKLSVCYELNNVTTKGVESMSSVLYYAFKTVLSQLINKET